MGTPTPDYARSVLRQAVCQICEDQGFSHVEPGALDILHAVLERYFRSVPQAAKQLAELSGRSSVNLSDLRDAMGRCSNSFGVLTPSAEAFGQEDADDDAMAPTFESWLRDEIPEFPIQTESACRELRLELPAPRGKHIPAFLPDFPSSAELLPKPARKPKRLVQAEAVARNAALEALLELAEQLTVAAGDFCGEYKDDGNFDLALLPTAMGDIRADPTVERRAAQPIKTAVPAAVPTAPSTALRLSSAASALQLPTIVPRQAAAPETIQLATGAESTVATLGGMPGTALETASTAGTIEERVEDMAPPAKPPLPKRVRSLKIIGK